MIEKSRKYLSDILHAIGLIEEFTRNISDYNDYLHDLKTQSAVERQLSIIGEAITKYQALGSEFRLVKAEKIVGLRSRLITVYNTVDPAIVWTIIRNYLGPLKAEATHKIA